MLGVAESWTAGSDPGGGYFLAHDLMLHDMLDTYDEMISKDEDDGEVGQRLLELCRAVFGHRRRTSGAQGAQ